MQQMDRKGRKRDEGSQLETTEAGGSEYLKQPGQELTEAEGTYVGNSQAWRNEHKT